MHKNKTKNNLAFTIVELLIVIVIIGILAAITIISYRGITQRSIDATIQADLSNSSKKLKMYYALYNVYPVDMQSSDGGKTYCPTGPSADTNYCIKPSNGNVFTYSQLSAGQDFSLTGTKGDISYKIMKDSAPEKVSTVASTSFVKSWGGSGEDFVRGIDQTNDGGYVTTGYTASFGAGSNDAFLCKYDANGNLLWNKTWGGINSDVADYVAQSQDGGYVIAGDTSSFGAGSNDAFIAKFDSSGNLSWSRTWGGANSESTTSVIQTIDSGFAIAGYTASYGSGVGDAFIAKFDSSGNLSWSRTWGGAADDGAYGIIQSSIDGSFSITGYTVSYGAGLHDIFLAKYDVNGNLSWSKTWGGTNDDTAIGINKSNDGGYVVTGYSGSFGAGGNDAIMIKYDSNGNMSWNKLLGGVGSEAFYGSIQGSDNNFVTTGYMSSYGAGGNDMLFAKYDSSGNLIWNKTWGGVGYDVSAAFRGVIQSSDGGYVAVGASSNYGAGGDDSFLLKFKSDGTMNNCSSPMCQSPTATTTTPSATITTPSASVSSSSATVTSPTATVTTPSATVTTVVAP